MEGGDPDRTAARAAAKPPVRKLAKDLGVDLTAVAPTGPGGTITREDVHGAARRAAPQTPHTPVPDASRASETRVPVRGVRRHTAAAMVASAFTAPHVTEFITVDVTATMRLRELVAGRREFRDLRVTPLLFFARALLIALAKTPEANSSWDEGAQEIVLKHYVNLGVAAATDRGLVVPNIKGADRMSLQELAQALASLTATARAGRTSLQDMTGGTVTLTNVGVFGVDTGTPILNPGRPPFSPSAPSAVCPGSSGTTTGTNASSLGGSPSWRSPSTIGSWTADRDRSYWPASRRPCTNRGWRCCDIRRAGRRHGLWGNLFCP